MDLALNNLQRLICHKTKQTIRVVVSVMILSMGQIERFRHSLYFKPFYCSPSQLELLNTLTASLQKILRTSVLDLTLNYLMPSLPGPLSLVMVAPDRVLSMGQIEINCLLMLNWIGILEILLTVYKQMSSGLLENVTNKLFI